MANFAKFINIPVTVDGNFPPKPVTSFADSGLHSIIIKNVEGCGFTNLTPVQKYSIPIVLINRDLMACAQTGSGKTAAFLMPIIHQFLASGHKSSFGKCRTPQCLVITPTRELVIQIYNEAQKIAFSSGLRAALAHGGVSTGSRESLMAEGCNFLVSTPCRLINFMQQGKVSFKQIKCLVLDECDKMMDMGFFPDIRQIINHPSMPKKETRQTLMFSTTFPAPIKKIANEFLNNFLFLSVDVVVGACTSVDQVFYQVAKKDKKKKLSEVLKICGPEKTLVFIRTKHKTQRMAQQLTRDGFAATCIHGDRTPSQRDLALNEFREGTKDILLATDMVARGLDIKDVTHVINFDMPMAREMEEYVHRIGRMGICGKATSFYDMDEDHVIVNYLVKILTECNQVVPEWMAAQVDSAPSKSKKKKNKGVCQLVNKASFEKLPTLSPPNDELWDVYITSVASAGEDGPGEVYLRLIGKEYSEKFEKVSEEMDIFYANDDIPQVAEVLVGKMYAAMVDNGWHRVEVTHIEDPATVFCHFLDYGDVDIIGRNSLKELYPKFLSVPAQAFKVTLFGVENEAVTEKLKEELVNKSFIAKVEFVRNDLEVSSVTLFDTSNDEVDVNVNQKIKLEKEYSVDTENADSLIENCVPIMDISSVKKYFDVQVIWTGSPSFFIVRPINSSDQLEDLMSALSTFYCNPSNRSKISDVTEIQFFAVLHKDGHWYRAKVVHEIGHQSNLLVVRFVDYGENAITSLDNLQILAPKFRQLPMQAVMAKLADVVAGKNWTQEDIFWFYNRVQGQEFVSLVKGVEELVSGEMVIQLVLIDTSHPELDKNVAKELLERKSSTFAV